MAKVIGVFGDSGSGKTTSMRTLDSKTTYYIDCDKKGLSWKGWREQYNAANKNYFTTDFASVVSSIFDKVAKDEKKRIKTVVVDTINGLMIADEMRRMQEKNYDKWQDLAASIYFLFDKALEMPNDITVIFVAHAQVDHDENGFMFTRIKTSGRKLDKIVLESKMTTVLLAKCNNGKYVFETRANNSTAKTPLGAFEDTEIPNDMQAVLEALKDY